MSVTKAVHVDTSSERATGGSEPASWVHVGASDGLRDDAVPLGYEVVRDSREGRSAGRFVVGGGRFRQRVVLLRSALRAELLTAGAGDPEALKRGPLFTGWIDGGRTRHALVRTKSGDAWVVKSYRRGGALRGWNSVRYWGCERFLHELRVAAQAGRCGVATAEVLALVLEPAGCGSSRAWMITRYLPGVRPLHEYFGHPGGPQVCRAAGQAVARMHGAGIDHLDLHTGNIVCALGPEGATAYVLDWDRARCRSEGSWSPYSNLARLWRSVAKGHKRGLYDGGQVENIGAGFSTLFAAFVRGYFSRRPAALRAAREYFRRRAVWLGLRTFFWRPQT